MEVILRHWPRNIWILGAPCRLHLPAGNPPSCRELSPSGAVLGEPWREGCEAEKKGEVGRKIAEERPPRTHGAVESVGLRATERGKEEVVACGSARAGWSRRRGRLGVRSGHIGFLESLGRCSWFLVNPRDRLQGNPASRLVHFVSDTRPRHVIAQLLSSSLSRSLSRLSFSLPPAFYHVSPALFRWLQPCR